MKSADSDMVTYSVSLVSQGKHRFYTLSMPSDVLAKCSTVDTRETDPVTGFQRRLDSKRADDIAAYIDEGLGTIPSSIVLSAQPEADLVYTRSRRSITFRVTPKSFLILDGQHRVFGFSRAKTTLRVPVVIYNKLTRAEECRLFIDINTKQRPVPNALLLDIKRLAETETDEEAFLRDIFDMLANDPASPLLGKMSASSNAKGRISRVTFNAALKSIRGLLDGVDARRGFEILASYVGACSSGLRGIGCGEALVNPTVFRAFILLFVDVAERVNARFGNDYAAEHFEEGMRSFFERMKAPQIRAPGQSAHKLHESFQKILRQQFRIS